MDTHLLALQLMAFQGCLGAFDTIFHHELTESLPSRLSARLELRIHAIRSLIYSVLFIGLSAWEWHGVWAVVLLVVFAVEIVLTLWDFVTEDKTRLLPATERIIHTVLAMNGGAFITLLALNTPLWWSQSSSFVWHPLGGLSLFLALCGVGVGISGIRDGIAALSLERRATQVGKSNLQFGVQPEQILVTGGTGFIGQLLINELLVAGHSVTLLSRDVRRASYLFDGCVRCISSFDDLPESARIDVMINLAGARILGWRWTAGRQAVLRQSRVALSEKLVAWIARAEVKPRLLLSASAIGYYGVQAAGDVLALDESAPPQAIFMSQLCQEWEAAVNQAQVYGVTVCTMRFGLVLGQQGALPMMLLPIKCGLGGALGRGTQWHSWIHVQDLLAGMAHLWRADVSAAYNFTAPESVTQKQFSQVAATLLHRPCFFPTPAFLLRTLLGEQADLLLEGQRVAPRQLLETGFQFQYPTLSSALKSLL